MARQGAIEHEGRTEMMEPDVVETGDPEPETSVEPQSSTSLSLSSLNSGGGGGSKKKNEGRLKELEPFPEENPEPKSHSSSNMQDKINKEKAVALIEEVDDGCGWGEATTTTGKKGAIEEVIQEPKIKEVPPPLPEPATPVENWGSFGVADHKMKDKKSAKEEPKPKEPPLPPPEPELAPVSEPEPKTFDRAMGHGLDAMEKANDEWSSLSFVQAKEQYEQKRRDEGEEVEVLENTEVSTSRVQQPDEKDPRGSTPFNLNHKKEKARRKSNAEDNHEVQGVGESPTYVQRSEHGEEDPGESVSLNPRAKAPTTPFDSTDIHIEDNATMNDSHLPSDNPFSPHWRIPSSSFEPGKGKQATVEDENDGEDDFWSDRRRPSSYTRSEDSLFNLSETRGNKSPTRSEHSSLRELSFTNSSGVQVSSGSVDSDEKWSYIDGMHSPARPSRRPYSRYDSDGSPVGPRRRRPPRVHYDSPDDYPGYPARYAPSIISNESRDPYRYAPNPFAPPPDPYGYPLPGYVPNPYAPQPAPYGYAYPPAMPSSMYLAPTGPRFSGAPMSRSPPLSPPPPPPPPPPAPAPQPPSTPPPNGPASGPSNPPKIVSDSDDPFLPHASRRKPGLKSGKWTGEERRHPRRPVYNYRDHLGAAALQKDSRCHPYNIPFGDHGEPLSIDIKIRGPGRKTLSEGSSMGSWSWPHAAVDVEQHLRHAGQPALLNIVRAKRWFDSESHHTLDLTYSSQPSKDQQSAKDTMRWLHVERQHLDFDEFRTVISSVPDLSQDWIIVLLSLLKRIRKIHYDHSTGRFFPWTLRADSSELGLTGSGDTTLSATAISFPYFALGSIFGHGPRNTDQQYPIMSLFEWDDRFESAKEWDSEQSFRLMNDESKIKDSIIYVPHVWAIAFKDTIITYGQLAFDDLVDNDSIQLVKFDSRASGHATSVEVLDLGGCQFTLSLNQCRTFFALKQSIKVRCFANSQSSFDEVDIITPNNQIVNGEKWVSLLGEHQSSMIRLQLRRKSLGSATTAGLKSKGAPKAATVAKPRISNTVTANANQLTITRRENTTIGGNAPSDSSSDSESDSNEPSHYALALIPRPPRSPIRPALQTSGELVRYNPAASMLNMPNVSSLPPTSQLAPKNLVSTSVAVSDPNQRKRRLEEKGLIIFDPSAISKSPEIYAPPSTAVIQSRLPLRDTDSIREKSSLHSEPQDTTAAADELEGGTASTVEEHGPDKRSRITIPHFLTWATRQDITPHEVLSKSSIDSVVKILTTVNETLQEVKPTRHGRTYRRSREMAQIELEAEFPSLKACRSGSAPQISFDVPGDKGSGEQHALLVGKASQIDRVRANLVKACNTKLKHVYATLDAFLSLYVPLTSPSVSDHPLVQKCWGAFGTIMSAIASGTEDEPEALKYRNPEWWIVRDPSIHSILLDRRKPTILWKECETCQKSTQYRTLRDAVQHVQLRHFGVPGDDDNAPDERALALWLRSDNQYYADHRLELYIHYLDLIADPLREVYNKGRGIWDGVASDKSSMPSRFMLPKSLVNAFETAALLLTYATKAFAVIPRCSDPMSQHFIDGASKVKKDRDLLESTGKEIFHIGNCAKEYMHKAEQDVMLMSYTDVDTETISYDSVGPEYILATIMTSLFNRPLHAGEPVDLVYAGFYRKLHRDAMKHPRTRVLRKIWRMREELGLIASINIQQQELLRNYLRILEPCTFRATTLTRAARFRVEAPFIETQLRTAHSVHLRISDLDSRLEDVSRHVSRMLEIQQENNGNAIIVFTIVTIIFLPLSWATSYFGMNTSDIRDLAQGQWIFWVIALPVTSVVIGIAVLVVLKGDSIREFLIKREVARDRRSSASVGVSAKRRLSTRATGASIGRKQSVKIADNHLWRGFRRRTTKIRGEGEV